MKDLIPSMSVLDYDIKPSDGEAPALENWRMWNTPSLPFLPGLLWPGVVAPVSVQSMGQIEQIVCKQIDVKLGLLYNSSWNLLTVCKK